MKEKVGIIGLGFMGSAHARVYSQLKECDLVGICDDSSDKKYLAQTYHCKFFENFEDLLKEELNAVSICTPTSTHRDITIEALEKGKHVLLEKPLAINSRSGEEMVEKAVKMGKLLAVGYIERFNPVVGELTKIVDFSQIYSTVSFRFGPMPPRIKDIGVLLDLGTHEIDILNYLTKTRPEVIYTYVSKNLNNIFEDYAYLSLKYGHLHSHIETSWLPNYKLRLIHLYGNERFYILNYAQQNLKSYRPPPKFKIEYGSWQDILWLSRNVEEDILVTPSEPLKLQLKRFIESIKKGEALDPLCSGQEALDVLKVVENALDKLKIRK